MADDSLTFPPARQADIIETYHGVRVPDPYRWLEDADDPETLAWVAAQNALTRSSGRTPGKSCSAWRCRAVDAGW